MKLSYQVFLIAAVSAFSLTTHAFNDPETDYDSLYGIEPEPTVNNEKLIDIAVFETVTTEADEAENFVDPLTNYDSLYE